MNKVKLRLFKIENYLRDEESCQFLLDEVLADGDPRLIADVQDAIARWREISKGSEKSELLDEAVPLGRPGGC